MKHLLIALLIPLCSSAGEYVAKIKYYPAVEKIELTEDCILLSDFKGSFGKAFKTTCKTQSGNSYKCDMGFGLGTVIAIKYKDKNQCTEVTNIMRAYKLNSSAFFE